MKIIIPILVGSAIGYFTNWLAIKMLFRPLQEKKILGIKLPFTPGLIPKERKRIANSIGEAVGMHLLTPEKIAEVVSSKETKGKLEKIIKLKIDDLKESNRNLNDFFASINYRLPIEKISEKSLDIFLNKLRDEQLISALSDFIKEDIYPIYKNKIVGKISNDGKTIFENLRSSIDLEEHFIEDINNKLKELKDTDIILSDAIEDTLIIKLEDSIEMNKKDIMDSLRVLFYKEDIQIAITTSIEDLVESNLSKMITMFIDSKTISQKVLLIIKRYVDSKEAEEAASFIIKDSVKNLLNTKVSTIIEKGLAIIDEEDISLAYKKGLGYILKDENVDKFLNMVIENIELKEEEIKDKLDYLLKDSMENIWQSEKFKNIFKNEIKDTLEKLLFIPSSLLLKDLNEETVEKIFVFTNNIINTGFKEELFNIINLFDISKVVEDEINSFEVEYTEKLILQIADRELKAITRLGALLGAIMGLLTPLLQML